MAMEAFDPSLYTRSPILTIAGGITLARTLADACPKGMPPTVKKALKKLQLTADTAQAAWADRQRELGQITDEDSRLIDQEADAAWGALRSRLQAYAALPAARYPKAARAAELVVVLFGADGLSFLKEAYPLQWSAMDTILKRVDEDKLHKDIDHLAGPEFLDQIRHVHPRYDAMVKGMLQRNDGSGQNLLSHVRALQRAIVEYATKVCATVDDDEPETVKAAQDALRPLDQFRQTAARRGGGAPAGEPSPSPEPEKAPK